MPAPLQIKKLRFKAGAKVGVPHLEISPGNLTLFVGPNNSGKSRALRDIEAWNRGDDTSRKVVETIEVELPANVADAEVLLRAFESPTPEGQTTTAGHIWVASFTFNAREQIQEQVYLDGFRKDVLAMSSGARRSLNRLYTVRLDGRTRFALAEPQPSGDLQGRAKNHLWSLFKNDPAREKLREFTEQAFSLHFVVDPTGMTELRARMSLRKPSSIVEEQSLDQTARAFHAAAQLITELGDGIQAFTGLLAAVLSLPHQILLIDEPEAFLHPPLARRLGANLTRVANERSASLMVATHSADFVMGCLESSASPTVVRLTYEGAIATARTLSPSDLRAFTLDPLLRSTGALRGLFHRAVIVTEADRDRAFYDEINRRLQESSPSRGISDAVFLNAQNWQTTHKIAGPLRRLGIPAPIVLDIDTIADGTQHSSVWKKIYDACDIPTEMQASLDAERVIINDFVQAISRLAFKANGLNSLAESAKVVTQQHLTNLATFGVFVVPVGEVEAWLPQLGAAKGKVLWLGDIFTKLGNDPTAAAYIKPSVGEVWGFCEKIALWANNPTRLGIPT